uniref:Uncharacterized protein n=1 Tax=Rhizophora mucronata TaxID=61149 RepID=A0A2P2N8T0_RHIMU
MDTSGTFYSRKKCYVKESRFSLRKNASGSFKLEESLITSHIWLANLLDYSQCLCILQFIIFPQLEMRT